MTRSARHTPALLTVTTPYHQFPDPESALTEPDGLLAIGGDLHPERLLHAYRQGIFPWFSKGQPILWWSPDPRCVLFPQQLKVSRSLRKSIRNRGYRITFDQSFPKVIHACALRGQATRNQSDTGTWLTDSMIQAYIHLHQLGYAHSVECWLDDQLAGGLYGIRMGQVFFGESMFSHETDASKVALAMFSQQFLKEGGRLIDCQVTNPHLLSLGAREIQRKQFLAHLDSWTRA